MKLKSGLVTLLFTLFAWATSGLLQQVRATGNPLDVYHQATTAYQKQDYQDAVKLYEQLLKEGNVSLEVYYNLGNAYYKSGNNGRAILNYERAKKLAPDDEDIQFNLRVAGLKTVDKIDPLPELFYKRWIHSFSSWLSVNGWSRVFLMMVWLTALSAGIYFLSKNVLFRKIGFILILFFLLLSGLSFVIARQSHSQERLELQAVVLSASTYVKSSPDYKGNDLFILHEGTKVNVLDSLNGWQKIRTANGSLGWIIGTDLEKI